MSNFIDLITSALVEAEWLAAGETAQSDDAQFALGKLNDMLDEWAAQERFVYNNGFTLFTLVPNLVPHTIGPSGATFAMAQRPVRIESAAVVISTGPTQTDLQPLAILSDEDWANIAVKNITSNFPTSVYYSPDVPNGSLFFWPIPTVANQVRIQTWGLISQVPNLQTAMVLAPGYRSALTLNLALRLAGPRSQDPILLRTAAEAIDAITQNNAQSPRMETSQAGMSVGRNSGRPDFDFRTGMPW